MNPREKILQRSSELFLSFGVKNVTMDSLAADLSISKRTIYEMFKDKDELVIECLRFMIINNNKDLMQIINASNNVVEALFLIIRREKERMSQFPVVFMEDLKKYFPVVHSSFYSCDRDLRKFSASFTLLERGIKEGVFRNDLKILMVDNYIHEMIRIIHQSERIRALNAVDMDILHNIFIPYFRGICTPKGLALMDQFFESRNE